MADAIRYDYEQMKSAANSIRQKAESYRAEGTTFVSNFNGATAAWEGDSKNQMYSFINGAVNDYLTKSVPEMLNALAELLDKNAEQMKKTDEEVSKSIPQTIG